MDSLLQVLHLMPVGVIKFNNDGEIDFINPAAVAILLPFTPDGALGNIFTVMTDLAPDLQQRLALYLDNSGTAVDQRRMNRAVNGKVCAISLTINVVSDNHYMATVIDLTETAEKERLILAERQRFRAICDHVHDYAIYTVSPEGIIDEWNLSLERYAGWRAAEIEGRSMGVMFPPNEAGTVGVAEFLAEARLNGSAEREGWRIRRDGSWFWGNTVLTAMPGEDGKLSGFVAVSRDISERKRVEDNMKRLATIDPLTGAYNRRQAEAWLAAEQARRGRDGRLFSVLLLDIDNFKAINDEFGHAVGDEVLRTLVRVCDDEMRIADVVARWGGEEFLLALPGADSRMALLAADRLRAALVAVRVPGPNGEAIGFTVSIGVATASSDDAAGLVRRADLGLYAAKKAGRNRVVLAEQPDH